MAITYSYGLWVLTGFLAAYTLYSLIVGSTFNIFEVVQKTTWYIDQIFRWLTPNYHRYFDYRGYYKYTPDHLDPDYSIGIMINRDEQPVGYWTTICIWLFLSGTAAFFALRLH